MPFNPVFLAKRHLNNVRRGICRVYGMRPFRTHDVEQAYKTSIVQEADIPDFDLSLSQRLWVPERQAIPASSELASERYSWSCERGHGGGEELSKGMVHSLV